MTNIHHSVKAYVTHADGNYIRVKTVDSSLKSALLNLGFFSKADVDEYNIPTPNNEIKATVFTQLRTLDVCFSSGREWSPAEVFQYLRDLKLLSGGFRQITWTGPNHFVVTDEK
ncbi:MAG: hypothetical protein ABIO21_11400 [Pseudomonas sp.]